MFFGTPEFAVPTLDALLASRAPVVGVVTQPDRPRGRGQKASAGGAGEGAALAPACRCCSRSGCERPRSWPALGALDADLGVVAAYGKILTDAVLAVPRLGTDLEEYQN